MFLCPCCPISITSFSPSPVCGSSLICRIAVPVAVETGVCVDWYLIVHRCERNGSSSVSKASSECTSSEITESSTSSTAETTTSTETHSPRRGWVCESWDSKSSSSSEAYTHSGCWIRKSGDAKSRTVACTSTRHRAHSSRTCSISSWHIFTPLYEYIFLSEENIYSILLKYLVEAHGTTIKDRTKGRKRRVLFKSQNIDILPAHRKRIKPNR